MEYKNEYLGIDLILDDEGELVVSPSGDLAVTEDGRLALLQDIKHLLESLPGDLFSHPEYGSGLGRLLGEERNKYYTSLIERAISDALDYHPSIVSRIKQGKIKFTVNEINQGEFEIELQVEELKDKLILK